MNNPSDAAGAALDEAERNAEPKPDPARTASGGEPRVTARPLAAALAGALALARRRSAGEELPIELPWPSLAEQFGGGLWPGLHVLVSGTGVGKTTWAIQASLHAARSGSPVAYVGLELGEDEVALRFLGDMSHAVRQKHEHGVAWSKLWLGKAGEADLRLAERASAELARLPIFLIPSSPQGYPATALHDVASELTKLPGDARRPRLLVVDFLQIIGDEPDPSQPGRMRGFELRERIGRAAYIARHVASKHNVAVLMISSVARNAYNLDERLTEASPGYERDSAGRPTKRHLRKADALVGLGKESGEIEFSADSVTVAIRTRVDPETAAPNERSFTRVVFATAKGRATGTGWTELHFNGWRYEEPEDGGARLVDAWKSARREAPGEKKPPAPGHDPELPALEPESDLT